MDLWVVAKDGQVYTTSSPGGGAYRPWSGMSAPRGGLQPGAPITAISRHANHMDLWVVAKDGQVYTTYWPH
jgi:hypothetical protein